MLKALGIGKKHGPKDDKDIKEGNISEHRKQKEARDQWQADSEALTAIVQTLRSKYASAKGDFALNRYEELKAMIKEAVHKYQQQKDSAQSPPPGGDTAAATPGGGKKLGLISQLRQSSAGFSGRSDVSDKGDRQYAGMTSKDLDRDKDQFRRDILKYKMNYRAMRDRIEKLNQEYEDSKRYNPTQRYPLLKNMIKTATRESAK